MSDWDSEDEEAEVAHRVKIETLHEVREALVARDFWPEGFHRHVLQIIDAMIAKEVAAK